MRGSVTGLRALLLMLLVTSAARAQEFVWAKRLGGTSDELARAVALDGSGNVHLVGSFQGTVDFDPGPGVFNLTAAGFDDVFVSKLDGAGNLLWARRLGGTDFDYASGVAVDAAGNVYTVGYFAGTVDFDPGPGVFNLTAAGFDDAFVSKLDSAGNFVWARRLGGAEFDQALGVAVHGAGNVYTVGYFYGTADFDPGPGVAEMTAAGFNDAFVVKLDGAGNFVWAKRLGGAEYDFATAVGVDGSGNVITVGEFSDTVDFDPGPGTANLTSAGLDDVFVSKLDGAGNFVWAKRLGGTDYDEVLGVAVGPGGSVHAVGYFAGTADFDPGPATFHLTAAGNFDVFIVKVDGAGNFAWAKRLGATSDDWAFGVAVDGGGNVYTVGFFGGTVDFDPGPGIVNLTSAGLDDAFVVKLDGAGGYLWARRLGGTDYDEALGVAVDGSGHVYTVGYFYGTADFDPGPGTHNLVSAGLSDAFVSKLGPAVAGAGAVPDGKFVSGVPLRIAKGGGAAITLSWGASCRAGDADYAVYEGTVGSFASHAPVVCSTAGATTATFTPGSGNRYYLVVPRTGSAEGSYGKNKLGVERPTSALACAPQSLAGCP